MNYDKQFWVQNGTPYRVPATDNIQEIKDRYENPKSISYAKSKLFL